MRDNYDYTSAEESTDLSTLDHKWHTFLGSIADSEKSFSTSELLTMATATFGADRCTLKSFGAKLHEPFWGHLVDGRVGLFDLVDLAGRVDLVDLVDELEPDSPSSIG